MSRFSELNTQVVGRLDSRNRLCCCLGCTRLAVEMKMERDRLNAACRLQQWRCGLEAYVRNIPDWCYLRIIITPVHHNIVTDTGIVTCNTYTVEVPGTLRDKSPACPQVLGTLAGTCWVT